MRLEVGGTSTVLINKYLIYLGVHISMWLALQQRAQAIVDKAMQTQMLHV